MIALLTPTDKGQQFQKAFTSFVMMFAERQNFVSTMAPFASRKVGPEWFTRPFPSADEEDLEDEYVAIWESFLRSRIMLLLLCHY